MCSRSLYFHDLSTAFAVTTLDPEPIPAACQAGSPGVDRAFDVVGQVHVFQVAQQAARIVDTALPNIAAILVDARGSGAAVGGEPGGRLLVRHGFQPTSLELTDRALR